MRDRRDIVIKATFLALMISVIAIPNSVKILSSVLLATLFLYFVSRRGIINFSTTLMKAYFLTVLVTAFYLLIGVMRGASTEAFEQVILIYVISPLMWTCVFWGAYVRFGQEMIIHVTNVSTIFALATVPLFFMLFSIRGPGGVTFFIDHANVQYGGGYAGATMHVFGSLIFVLSGYFASPAVIRSVSLRAIILISGLMVALISGRAALIVSIAIGTMTGVFVTSSITTLLKRIILLLVGTVFVGTIAIFLLDTLFHVNITAIIAIASGKILDFGGLERRGQLTSLWNGALDYNLLGKGHGLGTNYLRSREFPWRYELVWFAVLLRTGIIGLAIYAAPFVLAFFEGVRRCLSKNATEMDRFMLGGFASVILSSFTNPYIEGVMLQWMFVWPLVHFLVRFQDVPHTTAPSRQSMPVMSAGTAMPRVDI